MDCGERTMVTSGAEGSVYRTSYLGRRAMVKIRSPKQYRIPELDRRIRSQRIRAEARLIREVRAGQDIAQYISQEHSSAGRGGMESKCHIALAAAQAGIHVYIANGKREHVLTDLLLSPTPSLPFTHFLP